MKRRVIKPLVVHMIGAILTQGVILGYNPLATAWMSAVTAIGGGYIIMFPIMLIGLYYSMGLVGMIKYGTLMVAVSYMVLLHKKKEERVNINTVGVMTGISTFIMELGEWFMDNDVSTLYGADILYDSYYQLFVKIMLTIVSGSGAIVFSIAVNGFLNNSLLDIVSEETDYNWIDRRITGIAMGFRFLSDRILNLPAGDIGNEEMMDVSRIASQLTGEVCASCVNSGVCFGNKKGISKSNILKMVEGGMRSGNISSDLLSEELSGLCINQGELIIGANNIFERARLNYMWSKRMEEGREAVAIQLNEMADIIEEIGGSDYHEEIKYSKLEKAIATMLKNTKNPVRRVSIKKVSKGVMVVNIRFKRKIKKTFEHNKFLREMSKLLQTDMEYDKCDDFDINLVQKPNYNVLYGVAKRVKDKEEMSGDNYSVTRLKYGQYLMSVCDGMGTGKKAGKYSGVVLDLLEQLMKNGFGKQTSLKLINSALMMGNQWDSPMAIDVAMVDLYSGTCNLLKMGAACTYIKRGNWVECIKSATLPIGALKNPDMETVSKKMYNGDFIIMVSDGIIDSLEGIDREGMLGKIIMDADTNNPQKMANLIMEEVSKVSEKKPKDDMTVLVAGVWDKI